MKKLIWAVLFMFVLAIVLIPAVINWPAAKQDKERGLLNEYAGKPLTVNVYISARKKTVAIPLEEYLIGVVAAEMPANFETEALKAQAVAARTYTIRRMLMVDPDLHPGTQGAKLCDRPTHCQAWFSSEELKKKWGMFKYPLYIYKIKKAVQETKGKVLVYNNQLADPVYHGSCGGAGTEKSGNVWKYDIPYLQAVKCQWDDLTKPGLINKTTVSVKEFAALLNLPGKVEAIIPLLKNGIYSKNKRLISVKSGSEVISGNAFRTKLGLASSVFSWEIKGDKVTFTTKGKGHGVGMCQYGANGMAKAGKNYREILAYYYKGTEISSLVKFVPK
ncbi:stage II sporulation protein D [Thermincola ferriacetica]